MSDESSVQTAATQVLGEKSRPRQLIRVDKAEFTKLLHQVLASKTLFQYLQTVSGENKRLKQQNDELRKVAHRTQRAVDEIVLADSKVSGQIPVPDSGSMSLPSYFDFETQTTDYITDGRYSSITEQKTPQSLGYFSKSPKSLLQSSLYVSEPSLTRGDVDLQESRSKMYQFDEREKSDPCKDEETGLSLNIDGEIRSLQVIPKFHLQVGKNPSPSTSPPQHVSPNPSLTSGFEDHESISSDNLSEQSGSVSIQGVSKQYFDVVVKELAKSKQLIKQLLAKNSESPKEVLDRVYLKQMVKSLDEENRRLKESNKYYRTLLVTQATSEDQQSINNNEILNYHDKVQKLERQVELKDQALEQLNRQTEICKQHGQKAPSTQVTSSQDDQVFSIQMRDAEIQTFPQEHNDKSAQTEDGHLHQETESTISAMLTKSQVRVRSLERMIGDLTTQNQSVRETVDLLTAQNRNLEMSYQQQLQTLKDLERNQDTAILQRDLQALAHENEDMKERLKENVDEMKFLRYQVQSAQSEQGTLSQKKTRAEAMLKSERERNNQREAQLLTEYSKLQMRLDKLERENETLRMRVTSPQTNIARVQPVVQDPSKEPTSMPVTSHDFLWQKGGRETSLTTDSDSRGHPKHLSDPCLLKSGQRLSKGEQFQCHHCLRNDFHDEKSFFSHMQKCGD